ncbi:MAG: tyrosine-type recombinase/integrase [Candidatus Zixiibacteriota bacterium]
MRVFNRGKNWYVDYAVDGRRVRKSFGRQKKVAELYLKNVEVKMAKGEELSPKYDPISWEEFIAKYLDYSLANKSTATYETDCSRIKVLNQFLSSRGIRRPEGITPGVIDEFRSVLLPKCTERTFGHYLTLVKAMLNKAVSWRHIKENPLAQVKKVRPSNARQIRFLTSEEISTVLEKADPFMQKVIRILLYTGMRRSELVYLAWEDIDFHNKLIHVQSKPEEGFHPKSRRARSIPINPDLEQLLLDLPQRGRYIFDDGNGRPQYTRDYYTKHFAKITKSAEVKNATLHTLRHTFASHLVMSGVDLRTVQELLGHSTVTMTEQYSHLSPDHRTRAVNRLNFGGHGTELAQNRALGG